MDARHGGFAGGGDGRGQDLRAAADENAELFWALWGGGPNFGIVSSFEYRVFPVGPEILGGAIAWRAEEANDVLEFLRAFSVTTPRATRCVVVLRITPPAPWLPSEIHGKPIIAVFVAHSGYIDAVEDVVALLRALGRPVADIVTRRPAIATPPSSSTSPLRGKTRLTTQ